MRRLVIMLGALALLASCTSGEVGSACTGGAAQNDCVEGAVCTLERSDSPEAPALPNNETFVCRRVCDINANCEVGFECRQAAGTMFRSCQPSDTPPGDGGATPSGDAGM